MQKNTAGCFGPTNRLVLISIATISLVLSLFCHDRALAADSHATTDSLPNIDKRLEQAKANQLAVVNAAKENAASVIRNRVKDVRIDTDEILGSPKFAASMHGLLPRTNSRDGKVSAARTALVNGAMG